MGYTGYDFNFPLGVVEESANENFTVREALWRLFFLSKKIFINYLDGLIKRKQ